MENEDAKLVIVLNGDWDDYRPVEVAAIAELELPDDSRGVLYDKPEKLAGACALLLVTHSEHLALLYRRHPGYKPSATERKFITLSRGADGVYKMTGHIDFFENGKIVALGKKEVIDV